MLRSEVPVPEARKCEHLRAVGRDSGKQMHCVRSNAKFESDGPEELWMTECVGIANRHEHAGEVAPVSSTPYFLQSSRKGPLGVG